MQNYDQESMLMRSILDRLNSLDLKIDTINNRLARDYATIREDGNGNTPNTFIAGVSVAISTFVSILWTVVSYILQKDPPPIQ